MKKNKPLLKKIYTAILILVIIFFAAEMISRFYYSGKTIGSTQEERCIRKLKNDYFNQKSFGKTPLNEWYEYDPLLLSDEEKDSSVDRRVTIAIAQAMKNISMGTGFRVKMRNYLLLDKFQGGLSRELGDRYRVGYAFERGAVHTHTLIMLTNVDGLYYAEENKVIPIVTHINRDIEKMPRSDKSIFGMGGMRSKLQAVKIAVQSGITCIIANGGMEDVLLRNFDFALN